MKILTYGDIFDLVAGDVETFNGSVYVRGPIAGIRCKEGTLILDRLWTAISNDRTNWVVTETSSVILERSETKNLTLSSDGFFVECSPDGIDLVVVMFHSVNARLHPDDVAGLKLHAPLLHPTTVEFP